MSIELHKIFATKAKICYKTYKIICKKLADSKKCSIFAKELRNETPNSSVNPDGIFYLPKITPRIGLLNRLVAVKTLFGSLKTRFSSSFFYFNFHQEMRLPNENCNETNNSTFSARKTHETGSTSKLWIAFNDFFTESERKESQRNELFNFGGDLFKYVCELYLNLINHAGFTESQAFTAIQRSNFNPFAL